MLGFREILIIALIIVLLFGARKIPALMGDFAKGIKSFRKGLSDDEPTAEASDGKPGDPPRQIPHHSAAADARAAGAKQSEG